MYPCTEKLLALLKQQTEHVEAERTKYYDRVAECDAERLEKLGKILDGEMLEDEELLDMVRDLILSNKNCISELDAMSSALDALCEKYRDLDNNFEMDAILREATTDEERLEMLHALERPRPEDVLKKVLESLKESLPPGVEMSAVKIEGEEAKDIIKQLKDPANQTGGTNITLGKPKKADDSFDSPALRRRTKL